jgi:hypothetical protein
MPAQPVRPMAVPLPKPPEAPSSPPPEPAKPRPPVLAEATTQAAGVAEASSGHDAVPEESARAHENRAATRQGSLTEEKEFGHAIARNPALRVPLREQNPDLARRVEELSKLDRDRLSDQAPQQMPQPSPEPEPEPPGMGM